MQHYSTLLKHIHEFEEAKRREAEESNETSWNTSFYQAFLIADIRFRKAANVLSFSYPEDLPTGTEADQMGQISLRFEQHVSGWKTKILALQLEAQASLEYENKSSEFSEAIVFDTEHKTSIHEIISELRDVVYQSEWLGDERKQRVLRAVNSVQSEVDKELSNFHLILGKVVDLGEALGKAGKKAKPAFDRVEQLANAVRGQREQSTAIEKDADPLQIEDMRDGGDE
ncbi:hypothetical protein [Phaeobacter inhibens]|uniref:hypothetical protein n=1 Tax=Phaeobacter inhibens TaxID=221822 RepID=UPI000CA2D89A|nr:hypothetical protein [Phaeobacter inhibens]AUQ62041.1 hypothetical protein PhaeoP51_01038 [Phaeobacter inhibens]AUQ82015.1 hypothetical protein PhaeoP57_01070 [Phaeobacter inhibens]AUQ89738.1 hypothetical protein PhaeoP24_01105 [Phaeobacter inhibens]MDO6755500.1 hypothetical protein [Phaeobacter inhibens]